VLADWDAFTTKVPTTLTAAHAFLNTARPHALTCLNPDIRKNLQPSNTIRFRLQKFNAT
jgi:hypothetical protein